MGNTSCSQWWAQRVKRITTQDVLCQKCFQKHLKGKLFVFWYLVVSLYFGKHFLAFGTSKNSQIFEYIYMINNIIYWEKKTMYTGHILETINHGVEYNDQWNLRDKKRDKNPIKKEK